MRSGSSCSPQITSSTNLRAAEYVRMSTEGQQYSIANQQEAIRQYASERSLEIVRTYADPGKSGLRLQGRDALIQLLSDVQNGRADFDVVLVYDVSRWGRFQDTDESGYYEYLCRRANVRVEYCTELFENDGGPLAAILKNIKRVMAAEYSREQSARVFQTTCRTASLGHFTGGSPPYGYRRMLVGPDGRSKGVLERGLRRSLRSDYMILVPGPAEEVSTVRRIFRLYAQKRLTPQVIADKLNREGRINALGRPWHDEVIWAMLQNERYVGTLVYNQRSRKLRRGPRRKNPRDSWIVTPNAFEGIVSPTLFAQAQARIGERRHRAHTDESLLARLRYLLETYGYLSVAKPSLANF